MVFTWSMLQRSDVIGTSRLTRSHTSARAAWLASLKLCSINCQPRCAQPHRLVIVVAERHRAFGGQSTMLADPRRLHQVVAEVGPLVVEHFPQRGLPGLPSTRGPVLK
jgi:hypothetical protein